MNKYSDQVKRELIDCVKAALLGKPVEAKPSKELLQFARIHGLGHLVGSQSDAILAIVRTQARAKALSDIRKVFSDVDVQFVALKGAVLCKLYPEEWMRSSSDLDILVHYDDFDKVDKLFTKTLGYKFIDQNDHHAGYIVNENMHVEIHFGLFPNEHDDAWEYAAPIEDGSSEYAFSDEFFISYLLKHMKKHFIQGGCGVRPMIDLYLLLKGGAKLPEDNYANLCSEFLKHFDTPGLPFSEFDQLVLEGGLYGTDCSISSAGLANRGSSLKFLMHHMFPPMSDMVAVYPRLKKVPALLPFAWVKYGFFRATHGHMDGLKTKIKSSSLADSDMVESMKHVFSEID